MQVQYKVLKKLFKSALCTVLPGDTLDEDRLCQSVRSHRYSLGLITGTIAPFYTIKTGSRCVCFSQHHASVCLRVCVCVYYRSEIYEHAEFVSSIKTRTAAGKKKAVDVWFKDAVHCVGVWEGPTGNVEVVCDGPFVHIAHIVIGFDIFGMCM